MNDRIREARTLAACDAIDRCTRRFIDDAHQAAINLEQLGHGAVTDVLDQAIANVLMITTNLRGVVGAKAKAA